MDNKEQMSLQMQCILLFESNPAESESLHGLESKLGISEEKLLPVLDVLVKQGIIQLTDENSSPSYRYKEPQSSIAPGGLSELETT